MNRTDRRRAKVATVFTIVALLTLWIFNREPASSGTVAVAGATTLVPVPSTTYVPQTPAFVGDGDTGSGKQVIEIAVPAPPSANNFRAIASYRRFVETLDRPCSTLLAPDGAVLTITNVDNGQSTVCNNTLTVVPPEGVDLILDTAIFGEISDVADAPIPVRVSL